MGQLSKRVTETPPSNLPSNTEENPKRKCKAIDLTIMAEPTREEEDVNPSKEDILGRSMTNKEFPFEEPKEYEAHTETIEIPLNLLLPFMSFDEYSSSEEDENIVEEQVS